MAETEGILQTPNIGLYKPDYTNIADIQVLNENFDKLDTTIKQAGDDLIAHNIATEAHENRFNQYLPLTGGTMTGVLRLKNGVNAYVASEMTDSLIRIFGGTSPSTGANLDLYGEDEETSPGDFILRARNTEGYKALQGKPDGKLTWNGNRIDNPFTEASISGKVITLTFADGTTKTLTTQDTAPFTARATAIGGASTTKPAVVVTTYRNGDTWYRIWSDGWKEQGGLTASAKSDSFTVTFPKAFSSAQYHVNFVVAGSAKDDSYGHMVTARTTTTFTFSDWLMNNVPVMWHACGY